MNSVRRTARADVAIVFDGDPPRNEPNVILWLAMAGQRRLEPVLAHYVRAATDSRLSGWYSGPITRVPAYATIIAWAVPPVLDMRASAEADHAAG